ncbi:Nucleolar protein 4 [Branchiostoma belcheri]|nr:Nucleolar protein 4 [Branchiostoma belcheri]
MAAAEQHVGPEDALCECRRGWEELKPGENPCFHRTRVHPSLIKHIDQLTGGQEGLRFLLPLCGKSLDMKWFSSGLQKLFPARLNQVSRGQGSGHLCLGTVLERKTKNSVKVRPCRPFNDSLRR